MPALPNSSAMPFPIPREAPVTMATLELRFGTEYVSTGDGVIVVLNAFAKMALLHRLMAKNRIHMKHVAT